MHTPASAPPGALMRTDDAPPDAHFRQIAVLGLCPLLPACVDATRGLALGVAVAVVPVAGALVLAPLPRRALTGGTRALVAVLALAAAATAAQRLLDAWVPALAPALALFVPLIVAHGGLRRSATAADLPALARVRRGLRDGLGLAALLLALGAARELAGQGTLFAGAGALPGAVSGALALHPFGAAHGLRLAALTPGAFVALALLLALKRKRALRAAARAATAEAA
ncbi:MAG: Rnf-Nqr domain containing protein [Mizugakiibacter sp.]|uniref:Rnf-Nqr domain containing protein n=1 Tax=Mizugakiibacter sp. TaxID=1972610 RepID=UPI0031C0BA15|nr:hypothetical protein [Xanthomonadaceae bacterium]